MLAMVDSLVESVCTSLWLDASSFVQPPHIPFGTRKKAIPIPTIPISLSLVMTKCIGLCMMTGLSLRDNSLLVVCLLPCAFWKRNWERDGPFPPWNWLFLLRIFPSSIFSWSKFGDTFIILPCSVQAQPCRWLLSLCYLDYNELN